ncbi:MAG TPA: polynucleotide adenylyltransferase PcnB [Anaeromyxobacteraceae bacterium]|nr:polynucleotide adenylyltransferase PcnB [Anaeromyxobacteraceae bacterium]
MHPRSPLDPSPAHPEFPEPSERPPPRAIALDPPEPEPPGQPEIPADRLDPDALKVIYRLRHVRHQAYLVGGCVRDLLLGRSPKDFDVATDAHPGEVRSIFRNCRLIGRRFRLAHVYFRGGKVIEVATFRKNPVDVAEDVPDDGDLLITRDNVFGTAEEDAVRRDFTVNGLFYDPARGEVIDYVGGRADLEAHRISTIGDPEVRMREDPVRALRAVRFAARLGFTIAPDTFAAMRRHAGELGRCAPPRVLEELFKLFRCGNSARAVELLRASGALPLVLPPLAAALDTWDEARRRSFAAHLGALDRMVRRGETVSEAVLLGALLVHLGQGEQGLGPEAEGLLTGLVQTARLPRRIAEGVRLALQAQRTFRDPARRRRRRGRGPGGQPHFEDAVQLLALTVEATGEGGDRLERLREAAGQGRRRDAEESLEERAEAEVVEILGPAGEERAAEGEGAPPREAGPVEAGAPSRKRRRRRGGRRRRRRGGASATA